MRPIAAVYLLLLLCTSTGLARADTPASAVYTHVVTHGETYPGVGVNSEGWFDVGGFCKVVDLGDISSLDPLAKGIPVFVPGPPEQWENYRQKAATHYNGQLMLTTCCRPQADIGTACATGTNPQSIARAYGRYGEVDSQTFNCIDIYGLPYQEVWNIACQGTTGNPAVDNGPDGQAQWALTTDTQICTPGAYTSPCSASCPTTTGTTTTYDSCNNVQSVNACSISCCAPDYGSSCTATVYTNTASYSNICYGPGTGDITGDASNLCRSGQQLTHTPTGQPNDCANSAFATPGNQTSIASSGALDPPYDIISFTCGTAQTAHGTYQCDGSCLIGCVPNGTCNALCQDSCGNGCSGGSCCSPNWSNCGACQPDGLMTCIDSNQCPSTLGQSIQEPCTYGGGGGTCPPVANGTTGAYPGCAITCNAGYTLSGNSCIPGGGGGGTCPNVANGTTGAYPGCAITCNAGYTLSGNSCTPTGPTYCAPGTTFSSCELQTYQCGNTGVIYDDCGNECPLFASPSAIDTWNTSGSATPGGPTCGNGSECQYGYSACHTNTFFSGGVITSYQCNEPGGTAPPGCN